MGKTDQYRFFKSAGKAYGKSNVEMIYGKKAIKWFSFPFLLLIANGVVLTCNINESIKGMTSLVAGTVNVLFAGYIVIKYMKYRNSKKCRLSFGINRMKVKKSKGRLLL